MMTKLVPDKPSHHFVSTPTNSASQATQIKTPIRARLRQEQRGMGAESASLTNETRKGLQCVSKFFSIICSCLMTGLLSLFYNLKSTKIFAVCFINTQHGPTLSS